MNECVLSEAAQEYKKKQRTNRTKLTKIKPKKKKKYERQKIRLTRILMFLFGFLYLISFSSRNKTEKPNGIKYPRTLFAEVNLNISGAKKEMVRKSFVMCMISNARPTLQSFRFFFAANMTLCK